MLKLNEVMINGMENPIGLAEQCMRISWKIESDRSNTVQRKFKVTVTEGRECQGSSEQDNTVYLIEEESTMPFFILSTDEFNSDTYYSVTVMVQDNHGETAEGSTLFMPGKRNNDWNAKWIGVQEDDLDASVQMVGKEEMVRAFMAMVEGDGTTFSPDRQLDPVRIYRKEFEADNAVSGILSITAHGIYEARINGKKVTNTVFNPGFTPYNEYLEFQTYDVSDMLVNGVNVLTVHVADGWYKGKYGILGYGNNYGLETALLAQLDIKEGSGEEFSVVSDHSFLYRDSSVLYGDFLIGESIDTRINEDEWYEAGINTDAFRNAAEKDYAIDNLKGITAQPVRILERLNAVSVKRCNDGSFLCDFGQVMVGIVELHVKGTEGEEIWIEHSEVLDENGVFINNISGANRDQKDRFILNGNEQTIAPEFTFHGFRYAKISGYSGELKKDDVTGLVLGTDLKCTGNLSCSDDRLNQLISNIFWSQRGNMLSIPTDCPQRERAGWTGDIQVYVPTASFFQDVNAFLTRWLEEMRIEQFEDGEIPVVIPYPLAYSAMQRNAFGSDTSAGWGDACIMVPWTLYKFYGDSNILSENWDMMKKWMNYAEKETFENIPDTEVKMTEEWLERQRYLWNTGFHFGDWLYPSCKNDKGESDMFRSAYTTKEMVATAMLAQSADQMSQIAGILGKQQDQAHYKELLENIRRAYAAEYIDENGVIGESPQGVYVLTLAMKMAPDDLLPKVAAKLNDMIVANGYRLDTGFLSIPYLMDVLANNGYEETANRILYQEACPSWLYEVKMGATTIWERWDAITESGKRTDSSYNHYAFGCIGDWMVRTLLGLRAETPGFSEITISPSFKYGLSHCEGKFDSIYGPISVKWEIDDGRTILNVSVPAGCRANIVLPGIEETVGSGDYSFSFNQ